MVELIGQKAVLVYPKFESQDTFWSFQRSLERYVPRSRFGLPKRTLPPLGLMGLYRTLSPYYEEIELVDRNIDPRPLDLHIMDADHVYMGGMIAQEQGFLADASHVKKQGKLLIAGGTCVDEESPLMQLADHLVENEAEMVMTALLTGLAQGNAEKYYRGEKPASDQFFIPDFSSIHLDDYVSMALQISRGCPEACEFCDITARFGKKPRVTPEEITEGSLRQLYDLGWRGSVFLVDDNFIGNPRKAISVLKSLYDIEERIGHHFPKYTELTMRLADESPVMEELREWMRKTNFTSQFIGVETPNEQSLRETGKTQNLRGEKSIVDKLTFIGQQTGAGIMAGMIHGFDHDTRDVKPYIDFVNSTPIPTMMIGLMAAVPHTKLTDRLQKEGRLKTRNSGNNSDGRMNFIPYNFSAKEAEEDYIKILDGIYHPDAFFKRVMGELKLLNPAYPLSKRTLRESIYSGFKILTGPYGFTYLKHFPEAHAIAKERFGIGTFQYHALISAYLEHCARFTHYAGQTQSLKAKLMENQVAYEPWQLYSWKSLQESPIQGVSVMVEEPETSLYDQIKMQLANGYEFVGTRFEALAHFVEPYLKEGLAELREIKRPNIQHFLDVEVRAYLQAHLKKPEILGAIDFSEVETHIRQSIRDQIQYLSEMSNLLKYVSHGELLDEHAH